MRKWKNRKDAGFSLLELLVVLAIMGLLAAIVAPQVMRYLYSSKTKTARVQIENVVGALELYRLDVGRYPTPEENLGALVAAPASATGWNGPYLQRESALKDPWGNPYRYAVPGKHGEIDVYSLGSDNVEGGSGDAQDVGNW
jgi:general secretion pathway protein G